MRNIKLTIAYDGTRYAGWQVQAAGKKPSLPTIQGEIEEALQKILREKIPLTGSGRTDAGAHALAQVANFRVRTLTLGHSRLKNALNGCLPSDIVILKVQEAPKDFHARFDAVSKTYRYVVINQKTRPAFNASHAYWVRFPLDVRAMRREAQSLPGRRDFKSFQARDRVRRSSVTTVQKVRVRTFSGDLRLPFLAQAKFITIDIQAKGFLRGMVRNIVGTLLEAGRGRFQKGQMRKILKEKDRGSAGPCVPARGLYLLRVRYE